MVETENLINHRLNLGMRRIYGHALFWLNYWNNIEFQIAIF